VVAGGAIVYAVGNGDVPLEDITFCIMPVVEVINRRIGDGVAVRGPVPPVPRAAAAR
jgi:hypothetical protein